MKHLIKMGWVLASAVMLCLTSCLNEASDPNSGAGELPGNVAALVEQVASMKTSVNEMESIQARLAEMSDLQGFAAQLEACVTSVNEHIASVEAGMSGVNATIAAMAIQSQIATTIGALKVQLASLSNESLQSDILSVEKGVALWLGKDFTNYYVVASEQASLAAMMEVVDAQSLLVGAIASDVEAGLRVGDASGLAEILASVDNSSKELSKLNEQISALCTEVEKGYSDAIKSPTSDTKSALKALNNKAKTAAEQADNTLAGLIGRIEDCEAAIADLDARLAKVEADVEELLGMIQSVSFLSDYSSDYAVAYYEMTSNKVSAPGQAYDGKNQREAAGTIDLSFMIRPASAAAAVTEQTASVFGYYAEQIQTRAVDPSSFVNFQIQSVSVTNAGRGIVTVKVSHDLKDDFYYKATSAKCALSIATGKTDITSKFVELVPKDNSSTVYVEEIKINTDDFEIDEGQSKTLTVTVNPSSATNKTVTWTSSNTEIATIDQYSGKLTAVKQGNVTITATTNGIDEWGDKLTASVNVKVNPSIRLGGPLYVEVGKNAELSLDFPPAMNVESKVWLSSDETKATVENGIVTGVDHTYNQYTYQYNPITITCIVNGNITLTHEMSVVVPQPRQIKLNNYGDDVKSVSMKLDQTISLAGSILPANVDASLFRMTYESDGGLGWIDFSSGEIKAPGSLGGRYVYIKVKDIDKHTYMKTFVERTVVVNVEPYYVQSISFADVELEPGANVTLVPTFTSDVSGKQPTTTKLTWESSNNQIATVDENGLVTALGVGDVTITATATDGSGVKGTCKVTITVPWKEFEVGQYVVRRSNGEIDFFSSSTDAKNNGTVVGVVIYKGNPRVSDTKLPSTCTHGIAVGLGQGTSGLKWWSGTNNAEPYNLYKYTIYCPEDGFVTPVGLSYSGGGYVRNEYGQKPYGYNNTMLFKTFMSKYGITSDLVNNLNNYSVNLPNETSGWYLPSIYEMYLVYQAYKNNGLDSALSAVGGSTLTNWAYWTVSEVSGNENSYAGTLNPVTGAISTKQKTTTSSLPYTRYIFAF